MQKPRLREKYRAIRANIHPAQAQAWGVTIQQRVLAHPWVSKARTVLCYVDGRENEVPTRGLIDALVARGTTVAIPMMWRGRTLEWHAFGGWEELVENRFGILEAPKAIFRPLVPPDHAVCIVPAIAYSPDGHRLGYGAGYYDRFLAGFQGHTIGLSYEATLLMEFSHEAHDIPVDVVVTEAWILE